MVSTIIFIIFGIFLIVAGAYLCVSMFSSGLEFLEFEDIPNIGFGIVFILLGIGIIYTSLQ